jgi:hypothetical protein
VTADNALPRSIFQPKDLSHKRPVSSGLYMLSQNGLAVARTPIQGDAGAALDFRR